MRRCAPALVVGLLVLVACGAVPPVAGSDAGSSRTVSPNAASPSPSGALNTFLRGDCTYPLATGTQTQPAPDTFQTGISVPMSWTLEDTSHSDTTDFLMTAPSTYFYLPTTISVSAPLPTDRGQSPSASLGQITQGTVSVTAGPQPCNIGGDPGAFLAFTSGSAVGYMVLWLHFGDAYLLQLKGSGGVDPRAVHDAKGVLASVTYAHNLPPPRYSPSPTS